jgi:hypothetical protein
LEEGVGLSEDAVEVLKRSRALLRAHRESQESEQLLEKLPQGHGSGLNADMVDGLHAVEILAKAPGKGGGGGSGGGSGDATSIKGKAVDDSAIGDGKVLGYNEGTGKIEYKAPAAGSGDMTKAVYDADDDGKVDVAENAEKLEGSTKAEVQDHAPKAHTHPCGELTDHDTALHDALGIDAATLETYTVAGIQDHPPAAHNTRHEIDGADLVRPYQPISGVWKITGEGAPFDLQAEDQNLYVEGVLWFDEDTGKMKVTET